MPPPAAKKRGRRPRLTLQCDGPWTFVGSKADQRWVWIAMDADSRRVLAVHVGDPTAAAGRKLREPVPQEYRGRALVHTDPWAAYGDFVPAARRRPAGKGAGTTGRLERFDDTLRQRCSRLVRKTLGFSKCGERLAGALWYFVHRYNASLLL